MILLAPILALIGGAVLPLCDFKSRKARAIYVQIITTLVSALVIYFLFWGKEEGLTLFHMTDTFSIRIKMDGLSKVFMGLTAFLWPLATLYAFEYMGHEKNESSFFTYYTMSYGVTLLIALSANLFTMYVFYEFLTLCTLPLVIHKRDAKSAFAGRRYLGYSIFGAALGFIGLIFVNHFGGNLDFALGGILNPEMTKGMEDVIRFVFLFAFIGFSAKAAIYPLSAWLPLASVAPTPVTALLHAVAVVKAGAFAVMRLTYYSFGTSILYGSWVQTILVCLTSFTIIYGAVMAVKEQHLKRRLAYSTVSNLSYVLLGVTMMTPMGLVGSLTHMVFHALMKITLFYCAGAILIKMDKEYVQDMRGMVHKMPFITVVFTISGIALVGVPPFVGFISKFNLITACIEMGQSIGIIGVGALLTSSILGSVYLLFPAVMMLFMPRPQTELAQQTQKCDPSLLMKIPLFVLVVVIVLLGMFSTPLVDYFTQVANAVAPAIPPVI